MINRETQKPKVRRNLGGQFGNRYKFLVKNSVVWFVSNALNSVYFVNFSKSSHDRASYQLPKSRTIGIGRSIVDRKRRSKRETYPLCDLIL